MDALTDILLSKKFREKILAIEQKSKYAKLSTNGSFINRLPKIEEKSIVVDGKVLKQGAILKRPIYKMFAAWDISHYGYVYGSDYNEDRWVIDKDADGIVKATEFGVFMKGFGNEYLDYIDPPKDFCLINTLNRSKSIESMPYSYKQDNCQRFCYYSVYGENTSPIIDFMKENKDMITDIKSKFQKLAEKLI